MPLTRAFKETVLERVQRDEEFRKELLCEAVQALISDELEVGKSILRDFINATVGFQRLSELTGKSPKSLMRMLSASGNPTASNLFHVVNILQEEEGVDLHVHASA